MERLRSILDAITPVDRSLESEIRAHLDNLTKPPGSLGFLEDLAASYCLMTGTTTPRLGKKRIVTFAGDHGVAAEGVSAFPSEVTPQMVYNMLGGGAAINVLAKHVGADLQVVDIGVADPLQDASGLLPRKVRPGPRQRCCRRRCRPFRDRRDGDCQHDSFLRSLCRPDSLPSD